ncbi:MAG: translation initiation factor IF-6 [Thermoplasmata archaeon]
MLKKIAVNSQPFLGVFSVATESFSVIPHIEGEEFEEALEVPVVKTTIGGTRLIGALACANSNGMVVGDIMEERELEPLLDHTDVTILPEKHNALGNNILVNDYGALVNPNIGKKALKILEEKLRVSVKKGTIAGINIVGSLGVVTNKGLICHPHVKDDEKDVMEELFQVPVSRTTANHGSGWIGTCIVANTKGAMIGDITTPIEMGRIEEGLGYLE